MATHFTCPSCQKTLRVSDKLLGKYLTCPACAKPFWADAYANTPVKSPLAPTAALNTHSAKPPTDHGYWNSVGLTAFVLIAAGLFVLGGTAIVILLPKRAALEAAKRASENQPSSMPENASAYISRGLAKLEEKSYDQAIEDFNEAIRLDPKDALAYNNRGLAWLAKESYDQAIEDFNEAIRLDPKDASAYSSRGWAFLAKKDYDRAIEDFDKAIRLDPKDASAYSSRGSAFLAKKDYDRAIEDFEEAIRLDPKHPLAHKGLAIAKGRL